MELSLVVRWGDLLGEHPRLWVGNSGECGDQGYRGDLSLGQEEMADRQRRKEWQGQGPETSLLARPSVG